MASNQDLLLKKIQGCHSGGALHGSDTLRPEWVETINRANRIDLNPIAADLANLTRKLQSEAVVCRAGSSGGD